MNSSKYKTVEIARIKLYNKNTYKDVNRCQIGRYPRSRSWDFIGGVPSLNIK